MTLDEREQRRWKGAIVRDALQRIGGVEVDVAPVVPAPRQLGYRNKIELGVARDAEGRVRVGYHSAPPESRLVDVERCEVQHPAANVLLSSVREFFAGLDGDRIGEGLRIVLRRSWSSGELLVAAWESGPPFPEAKSLAEHLRPRHAELAGVVRVLTPRGRRGGARTIAVWGRTWLAERVGDIELRLPAASFLQINAELAPVLLGVVVELAGNVRGRRVADLYGGVGLAGIALARQGATVTVCEADGEAAACGRQAARARGIEGITFHGGAVEPFLDALARDGRGLDVVVANPPRTGMTRRVCERIAACRPRRVVLVSCDPSTLARDARRLIDAGYVPGRATPLDMFPQTPHVETVLALDRVETGGAFPY
jgi:23S rRNA (uracil1939-C5)-methyltransferase